jgi:hypothetical protein
VTRPGPAPAPHRHDAVPPRARVRALLGKLRDLDLRSARIAVATGLDVALLGCTTPDVGAGGPLRYRLSSCRGDAHLELRQVSGGLELERQDAEGRSLGLRQLLLAGGVQGPLTAPEISARIDPDRAGEREVERFLRRVVRAAFA